MNLNVHKIDIVGYFSSLTDILFIWT